jgi:hypothetical protein
VPDHPDHEQLAAFQAGDGDRRQRAQVEAHLAGCPSCAEVVASVEQARRQLALLEEPTLPPGLHDRLASAVETEAAHPATDGPARWYHRHPAARPHASPTPGNGQEPAERPPALPASGPEVEPSGHRPARPGSGLRGEPMRRGGGRPLPWYRRPVAWGAAAALLLAALVIPFLDRSGGNLTTAGGGAADSAQEAATAGSGLLVIRIPGEVSAATVRSRLAADSQARSALNAAAPGAPGPAAGAPGASASGAPEASASGASRATAPGAQAVTPGASQGAGGAAQAPDQAGGGYRSRAPAPQVTAAPQATPPPQAAPATLGACLPAATAAADPAIRPLRPAFFIQGSYRGRQATILVTTSVGQPGRVDLWAFPRDNCSSPPLATERVR